MHYLETFKILLKDFKKCIGKPKFYMIFFLGAFSEIVYTAQPIFWSKIVSFIEEYLKSSVLNINEVVIFFIIFILYEIFLDFLLTFFYSFNFIEKTTFKFYLYYTKICNKKIINMTYSEYITKKSGKWFKTVDRGLIGFYRVLLSLMYDIYPSIVSVAFTLIVIFYVNIKMAIATIIIIPFLVFVGYYFTKKTAELQQECNKIENKFFAKLFDFMTNFSQVKIFNYKNNASKLLDDKLKELKNVQLPITKRWEKSRIYSGLLLNLSRILVLGLGIFMTVNGEITLAILFLFVAYLGYIYYPLETLFHSLRHLQRNLEGVKNLLDGLDNLEQDSDFPNSKELKKIDGKLHFDNVSFSYGNGKSVLNKLNFKINPGEKIAIVGNTGGGKSTIVSLIVRFFEVSSGEILIDDKNIQNFTKASLRKNIGIVMQDNSLFNTTIEENLKFAKPNATEKEMIEALKKANADFVFETELGIKSEIGERGLKLSGGEKQRLCIARVFLKDPKILILDEATSALDNKTEKQIQKTLDELMIGKTTIIIAHRLPTIKHVDKIIVLDKGKIIESGKYDELMKAKGKFFELASAKSENGNNA